MVNNHTSPVVNPSLDTFYKSSACTNYIPQWWCQSKFNFFTAILVVSILLTLLPLKIHSDLMFIHVNTTKAALPCIHLSFFNKTNACYKPLRTLLLHKALHSVSSKCIHKDPPEKVLSGCWLPVCSHLASIHPVSPWLC